MNTFRNIITFVFVVAIWYTYGWILGVFSTHVWLMLEMDVYFMRKHNKLIKRLNIEIALLKGEFGMLNFRRKNMIRRRGYE